jgi:hypothetical protein
MDAARFHVMLVAPVDVKTITLSIVLKMLMGNHHVSPLTKMGHDSWLGMGLLLALSGVEIHLVPRAWSCQTRRQKPWRGLRCF